MENAKILVANTAMDTDKIKIYGARVRVDSMQKVADIEKAERDKMRSKVGPDHPCSHSCGLMKVTAYSRPFFLRNPKDRSVSTDALSLCGSSHGFPRHCCAA